MSSPSNPQSKLELLRIKRDKARLAWIDAMDAQSSPGSSLSDWEPNGLMTWKAAKATREAHEHAEKACAAYEDADAAYLTAVTQKNTEAYLNLAVLDAAFKRAEERYIAASSMRRDASTEATRGIIDARRARAAYDRVIKTVDIEDVLDEYHDAKAAVLAALEALRETYRAM